MAARIPSGSFDLHPIRVLTSVMVRRVLFRSMAEAAEGLGLEWIAEVHNEEELKIAADADCKMFGICNRCEGRGV